MQKIRKTIIQIDQLNTANGRYSPTTSGQQALKHFYNNKDDVAELSRAQQNGRSRQLRRNRDPEVIKQIFKSQRGPHFS